MAEKETGQETPDWTGKVTETVESVVSLVRDHSLKPALTALRWALVALIALGLGLLAFVLGLVGIVRLLTNDAFGGRVWASDLVVGALCVLIALVLRGLGRHFSRSKEVVSA